DCNARKLGVPPVEVGDPNLQVRRSHRPKLGDGDAPTPHDDDLPRLGGVDDSPRLLMQLADRDVAHVSNVTHPDPAFKADISRAEASPCSRLTLTTAGARASRRSISSGDAAPNGSIVRRNTLG